MPAPTSRGCLTGNGARVEGSDAAALGSATALFRIVSVTIAGRNVKQRNTLMNMAVPEMRPSSATPLNAVGTNA